MKSVVELLLRRHSKTALLWLQISVLLLATVLPWINRGNVSAEQLVSRRVTISTSQSDVANVTYAFNFNFGSAQVAQGIIFEFCTAPIGTCVKPNDMDVSTGTANVSGTQTWLSTPSSNNTAFTEVSSSTGDCNIAGNNTDTKFCVSRTETESEVAGSKAISMTNVKNPELITNYLTVYVRISIYNNDTFTPGAGGVNIVHYGVVAAGITLQLTTQGRVVERLVFCVAAIDDGGATDTTIPANCAAAPSTTTIDLGTIDDAAIYTSPVTGTVTNGANDHYGIAMINTNASGGAVLTYYPEEDATPAAGDTDQLRAFRVSGANCDAVATTLTDQCFVSANGAGEDFTAGTERFGLQIPCIDTSQSSTATPSLGSVPDAYDNDDNNTSHDVDCENDDTGDNFAWNSSGTAATLASSTTVIDDEIVKLRFGATSGTTTPTGLYRVTTTYIATPTF